MNELRVRIKVDELPSDDGDRIEEIDRLLSGIAVRLGEGKRSGRLFDPNGAVEVGEFYFVDDANGD